MSIKIVRKKLQRHGNSWALVIDRPILNLLDWDLETVLEVKAERGDGLSIRKYIPIPGVTEPAPPPPTLELLEDMLPKGEPDFSEEE